MHGDCEAFLGLTTMHAPLSSKAERLHISDDQIDETFGAFAGR